MTNLPADEAVHVRAPGKINLYLRVGGVESDGYHSLVSVYQAVSLYEDVYAWPDDEISVSFGDSPIDTSGLATDDTNLAVRAAKLLATEAGVSAGARLEIIKRVPIAGGMGGGSADAAATLIACDALWGTGLPRERLLALGSELGADVPFALMGGAAVGTGRGDALSAVLGKEQFHWVLALAEGGLSTPKVYDTLDELRRARAVPKQPTRAHFSADPVVLHALRSGNAAQLAEGLVNDLQPAAMSLAPELAKVIELGERSGALMGIVSGSGPTIAFLAADSEAALELQVMLSAAQITAMHVHGPVSGARVVQG